jgi:iron complex transport system ATP-binding protein
MSLDITELAISVRDLQVRLGGVQVLHGLALDLSAGRWTSLVGPNGAGKSSLLKAIAQLLPYEGEVRLLGQPVRSIPRRSRAQQLAWLGQNEGGHDDLLVYDVALLGRLPHRPWLAPASQADHQAVEQALRATQAWDWRRRPLGQLSAGERQRLLLARALAVQAQVFLLDEPLTNLDPTHQVDCLQLIRQLVAQGKTVFSVLHDLSLALLADDLVVMAQGQLIHHGACSDKASHLALEQVFDHRIQITQSAGHWLCFPRF